MKINGTQEGVGEISSLELVQGLTQTGAWHLRWRSGLAELSPDRAGPDSISRQTLLETRCLVDSQLLSENQLSVETPTPHTWKMAPELFEQVQDHTLVL